MSLGRPRQITFDDLEFKIRVNPKGEGENALWVQYLQGDSVYDMMDEWVEDPLRWKAHYEPVNINGHEMIKCFISVRAEDGEWIVKEDIGAYSQEDEGERAGSDDKDNARKGGYSDSFKRCATRQWGIGRNVYQLKPVWAPCRKSGRSYRATDQTLPAIRREYAKLNLGWDLTGGERVKFAGGIDENPFPADHRPQKGASKPQGQREGPSADEAPVLPSKAFAALGAPERESMMVELKARAEEYSDSKGGGYWPIMTPAAAADDPGRAAEIVAFITGTDE